MVFSDPNRVKVPFKTKKTCQRHLESFHFTNAADEDNLSTSIGYFNHVTIRVRGLDILDHVVSVMMISCTNSGKMSFNFAVSLSANFRYSMLCLLHKASKTRMPTNTISLLHHILFQYIQFFE